MTRSLPMFFAVLCLTATPLLASAQTASGPDSTMMARGREAKPSARAPDEPGGGDRNKPVVSEGAKMDADCDKSSGSAMMEGGARGDPRADRAACRKLSDYDVATAPIQELRKSTQHTAVIGGRSIGYTATAGTLTIRDDEGKPTASMFYVAYTTGGTRRPVTFLYNGGPGSSTLWLHMGSLGPIRVATDSPRSTHNAPFDIVDNNESLLDKSDLVFIDAIGAGFSRPVGDTKLAAFWGTDPDIDAFARGIERYLTVNDRWNSPKFIFGESYGTTRSAGLAYRLQSDGAQLNGVILLSSILNYGRRDPGFDQELINYMPSFAAAAAYHNRISPGPTDTTAFLHEVREWARGPYALALAKGQDLPDADKAAIAHQMSAYTGLSERFILDNDLRVDASRFRKELLRDQHLTLGRYDARFTGEDVDSAGVDPGLRSLRHRHHRRLRLCLPPLSAGRPRLHDRDDLPPDLLFSGPAVELPAPAAERTRGLRHEHGRRGARPFSGDAGKPEPQALFAERDLRLRHAVLRNRIRSRPHAARRPHQGQRQVRLLSLPGTWSTSTPTP